MKKLFGIIILFLLASIIFLVGCTNVNEDEIKNLKVTITGLYYTDAECGEGRTLYLNVTWENTGDDEIEFVNPLLVNTDKGRERGCTFFDGRFDEIPPHTAINTIIMTYDSSSVCYTLDFDEKPQTFEYDYGMGEVIPPSIKEIKIPDSLIND